MMECYIDDNNIYIPENNKIVNSNYYLDSVIKAKPTATKKIPNAIAR
jgi:hypothetical protein